MSRYRSPPALPPASPTPTPHTHRPSPQVNEAFKDLAQIVEDQGHSLDAIEVNIGDAHARTESGVEQLQQAAGYQKKYRKWMLIMLLILVCVAAGITAYFLIKARG